jgi:hypothetical protein
MGPQVRLFFGSIPERLKYKRLGEIGLDQPGVQVPLGVREKLTGGTPNFENNSKQVLIGRIFYLGGTKRGYNFDLGVHRGVQS